MNEIISEIGKKIKTLRKQKGLTQAELAEKINVDSKYVSRLETGNSVASITTMIKISKVLNIQLSDIFTVESEQEKNKIIELINLKLSKINIKELNAILDIISGLSEK